MRLEWIASKIVCSRLTRKNVLFHVGVNNLQEELTFPPQLCDHDKNAQFSAKHRIRWHFLRDQVENQVDQGDSVAQ